MARFGAACFLLLLAIGSQATFTDKPGPVDAIVKLKMKAICKKLALLGNDQEEACKELMEEEMEKSEEIIYVTKVAPKVTGPAVAPKQTGPEIVAKKTSPIIDPKKTAQPSHTTVYPLKVVKVAQPPPVKTPTKSARQPFAGRGKFFKNVKP